jgi:hypothetical protein
MTHFEMDGWVKNIQKFVDSYLLNRAQKECMATSLHHFGKRNWEFQEDGNRRMTSRTQQEMRKHEQAEEEEEGFDGGALSSRHAYDSDEFAFFQLCHGSV